MLEEIGSEDNVDAYVEKQLAEKKKIMGIGHRVYKTLDPRAPHLRAMAMKLSEKLGDPKWIRMSERIAQLMKEKKNLNANVDFYSATVYYSLGIPTDLFTPIFAIARCSGWCAQVLEQLEDNRLYRPLSEYVGEPVGKKSRADRRATLASPCERSSPARAVVVIPSPRRRRGTPTQIRGSLGQGDGPARPDGKCLGALRQPRNDTPELGGRHARRFAERSVLYL